MAIPIPHRQLFIDGEWKEPAKGKRIPIINPANETVIGDIPAATVEDVELAVEAARRAFYRNGGREWARASGATRAKYLRSIASKIRERASELAKLEALDSGKPLDETTWDLDDVASCFEYYADLAESLDGKQRTPVSVPLQTFKSYVIKEPIGVVGLITPWNYPLLMATWKVAPALAAGCTAVLKPSELASVTCLELAEVCKEVELPPGVLNIITGLGSEAGAPLASHPLVDKILYRISSPMSSVNSSVRQDTRQHSQVYCHCHLKCVLYTCYRGPNRDKQFYRCIHNRTYDDCNFFKWIDELEEPSFDTHYALRGIDDKVLKKLDLLIFQMKVFIVFVAIDIIIRMYFA